MTLSASLTGLPASAALSDGVNNALGPPPSSSTGAPPPRVFKVIDNPTPHRLPEGENAAPLEVIGTTASDKLVIIMVGLPATGTAEHATGILTVT